ncbi:MAG: hypothetical protein C4324_04245 [Blastocatellia bacterium]
MRSILRTTGRRMAGFLPRRDYPVLSGPLFGARFVLGSFAGDGGGVSVFFNRSEPEQVLEFAATVKAGNTVLDIGANVRLYSILASRRAGPSGRVYAFEPAPRNIQFLNRHIKLNRAENVFVVEAACGRQVGEADFFPGPNSAMGSLQKVGGDKFRVTAITIDQFVLAEKISPDVIKIDVEGAELDVIYGAENTLSRSRPVIFLSTHSPGLRRECLERLAEFGYSYRPISGGDDPNEFILFAGGNG